MSEFKDVPEEVEKMRDSGIFDIAYTHATSHTARLGIEKTGKIMAPSIALAHDIVPFSGEPRWYTYLFRAYHVSVSSYPFAIDSHDWRRYISHGGIPWTPEDSEEEISALNAHKKEILEASYNFADATIPHRRLDIRTKIDACIELERKRQERWKELSEEQRLAIQNPQPEIYVFGRDLNDILLPGTVFGRPLEQHSHPYAPAEINLRRYLKGMFTSQVVEQTREWIAGVLGKEVPVASLDALDTWERRKNTDSI